MTIARIITILAVACGSAAQERSQAPAAASLSKEQWAEDLGELATLIREKHMNAFHTMTEPAFDAAIDTLRTQIPELSPDRIVLEMLRIVAMIADGHSTVSLTPTGLYNRYPISVYFFSEGLYIVHAQEPHARLVGKKIVAIGDTPIEKIYEAVEPYIPRDNEYTVKSRITGYMMIPELLVHLGIAPDAGAGEFQLEDAEGARTTERIESIPFQDYAGPPYGIVVPPDPPLYLRRIDEILWSAYLKKEKMVYAKFNAVVNREGRTLYNATRELFDLVDEKKARYLVIDARHNGGGNNTLLRPLIKRMAENRRVSQKGRLFVICGRRTFSAAQNFVTRANRDTNVLLVGEPAGGGLNHYGDGLRYTLSNSGVVVQLSSRFHQDADIDDPRKFVEVHIPAEPTHALYKEGRDPAMEAILEYIAKN